MSASVTFSSNNLNSITLMMTLWALIEDGDDIDLNNNVHQNYTWLLEEVLMRFEEMVDILKNCNGTPMDPRLVIAYEAFNNSFKKQEKENK